MILMDAIVQEHKRSVVNINNPFNVCLLAFSACLLPMSCFRKSFHRREWTNTTPLFESAELVITRTRIH